ncbi:hypothetical protein HZC31_02440 [Candidatus Woesearchaeota archaeon]|nr:hypothetical protein [Candidatus Woesearchaeota archaeon]
MDLEDVIREELKAGAASVSDLYRRLTAGGHYQKSLHTFYYAFKVTSRELPKGFGKRGRKGRITGECNALIHNDPVLTLKEIAVKVTEITGEKIATSTISNYMRTHGFYDAWKARRTEQENQKAEKKNTAKQHEEQKRNRLTYIIDWLKNTYLVHYAAHAAPEEKAQALAAAYYYGHDKTNRDKSRKISLEKLENLFQIYGQAQNAGEKLSLEELSQQSGIFFTTISRIFRDVGLEPLYGTRERKVVPMYKKEAVHRAIDLEMNSTDIAYFVGVPGYVALQNMKCYGREKQDRFLMQQIGTRHDMICLGYRHGSQVYEAMDAGFTREEILQLTELPEKAYDSILKRRSEIEPKIIRALQVMYDAPEHTVPYVTAELKEHLKNQSA